MNDIDWAELAREDALDERRQAGLEAAAARAWCHECYATGGHARGCPATPDEDDDA